MFEQLQIQSHNGAYAVEFNDHGLTDLNSKVPENAHFIVDQKVAGLYCSSLDKILASRSVLQIEATEENKSLDRFPGYVENLVKRNIRKNHVLVAIGGGIIQDITCFLAATLLRGLQWHFYPTTLLAQADSCIGSKSSINVGKIKNVMGTFTPPTCIVICPGVLSTLADAEVRSGIGEMLKVHAIEGPASFDAIATDYAGLAVEPETTMRYIHSSLRIKKRLIELDEFDRGPRNVLNYGHSFGHAIESATNFAVPHGVAVTIGMDMANYVAVRSGLLGRDHYQRMHATLALNYHGFQDIDIPLDSLLLAIGRDKKNVGSSISLILLDASARPTKVAWPNDATFRSICQDYCTKVPL